MILPSTLYVGMLQEMQVSEPGRYISMPEQRLLNAVCYFGAKASIYVLTLSVLPLSAMLLLSPVGGNASPYRVSPFGTDLRYHPITMRDLLLGTS